MTTVKIASSAIAAVTGLGSAVMQADVQAVHPFVVPLVSAVVGGLMSFAVLRVTVQELRERANKLETKLDDIATRVARIEGKLEAEE